MCIEKAVFRLAELKSTKKVKNINFYLGIETSTAFSTYATANPYRTSSEWTSFTTHISTNLFYLTTKTPRESESTTEVHLKIEQTTSNVFHEFTTEQTNKENEISRAQNSDEKQESKSLLSSTNATTNVFVQDTPQEASQKILDETPTSTKASTLFLLTSSVQPNSDSQDFHNQSPQQEVTTKIMEDSFHILNTTVFNLSTETSQPSSEYQKTPYSTSNDGNTEKFDFPSQMAKSATFGRDQLSTSSSEEGSSTPSAVTNDQETVQNWPNYNVEDSKLTTFPHEGSTGLPLTSTFSQSDFDQTSFGSLTSENLEQSSSLFDHKSMITNQETLNQDKSSTISTNILERTEFESTSDFLESTKIMEQSDNFKNLDPPVSNVETSSQQEDTTEDFSTVLNQKLITEYYDALESSNSHLDEIGVNFKSSTQPESSSQSLDPHVPMSDHQTSQLAQDLNVSEHDNSKSITIDNLTTSVNNWTNASDNSTNEENYLESFKLSTMTNSADNSTEIRTSSDSSEGLFQTVTSKTKTQNQSLDFQSSVLVSNEILENSTSILYTETSTNQKSLIESSFLYFSSSSQRPDSRLRITPNSFDNSQTNKNYETDAKKMKDSTHTTTNTITTKEASYNLENVKNQLLTSTKAESGSLKTSTAFHNFNLTTEDSKINELEQNVEIKVILSLVLSGISIVCVFILLCIFLKYKNTV